MWPKPFVNFENLHPNFWMKEKSKRHDLLVNYFVHIYYFQHTRIIMLDKNKNIIIQTKKKVYFKKKKKEKMTP